MQPIDLRWLHQHVNCAKPPEHQDQWRCFVSQQDGEAHIFPIGDLVGHEYIECPCGPRAECLTPPNGPDVWLYVHHALDGRP